MPESETFPKYDRCRGAIGKSGMGEFETGNVRNRVALLAEGFLSLRRYNESGELISSTVLRPHGVKPKYPFW